MTEMIQRWVHSQGDCETTSSREISGHIACGAGLGVQGRLSRPQGPLCFPDDHSEGVPPVGDGGAEQDHHGRLLLAEPDPARAAGRGARRLPHQAGGEGATGERGWALVPPCASLPWGGRAVLPSSQGQGGAPGHSEQGGWKSTRCPLAAPRSPKTPQEVEGMLRKRPPKLASHGPGGSDAS